MLKRFNDNRTSQALLCGFPALHSICLQCTLSASPSLHAPSPHYPPRTPSLCTPSPHTLTMYTLPAHPHYVHPPRTPSLCTSSPDVPLHPPHIHHRYLHPPHMYPPHLHPPCMYPPHMYPPYLHPPHMYLPCSAIHCRRVGQPVGYHTRRIVCSCHSKECV